MEDEIIQRMGEYDWTPAELDRRAKLEYDAFVIDQVRFNGKPRENFPHWNDLKDSSKLFYRHRAVRDT